MARTGMIRAIRLAAVLAAVSVVVGAVFGARTAQADVVTGQYSMEMSSAAFGGSVATGSTFVVAVGVFHDGTVPNYQGVQWKVLHTGGFVSTAVGSIALVGGAPAGACTSKSENSLTEITSVGCLDSQRAQHLLLGQRLEHHLHLRQPGRDDVLVPDARERGGRANMGADDARRLRHDPRA